MSKYYYYSKPSEDILFAMNILVGNMNNARVYSEEMDKLMKVLDPILDKPLSEDNPKYCCGDALEMIQKCLKAVVGDVEYSRDLVYAKALSFERCPEARIITDEEGDSFDISEYERSAFVDGFVTAIRYCNRGKKPITDEYEKD